MKRKIVSIDVDVHWFRRIFHTFAASFLIYYILPNDPWITLLKITISTSIVIMVILLEIIRLKGKIKNHYFFGLRQYETRRPGSYLYFGVALLILLTVFPQQIAIPCILCACFIDPIIGEIRQKRSAQQAYIIGFIICFLFFAITWAKAETWTILSISTIGAIAAIVGEAKKNRILDDDFMIQILPAILLFIIWQGLTLNGINILPPEILLPIK